MVIVGPGDDALWDGAGDAVIEPEAQSTQAPSPPQARHSGSTSAEQHTPPRQRALRHVWLEGWQAEPSGVPGTHMDSS